jgi:Leucine-rich repeat (LRR) protein
MKQIILTFITILFIGFGATAQNVTIPDANLKAYLVGNTAINTNADTEIQASEASTFTGVINCSGLNITDLTGIEAFTSLTQLDCDNNQLTSLDVSSNLALTLLHCQQNQLDSIVVSQNVNLINFRCRANQITSLDLSQNINLSSLYCDYNQLTSLDVSQNILLTNLVCYSNQLSSLNVSQNISLNDLSCHRNNIPSLDVSQNTALTRLICGANSLTSLDVSQNTALTQLNCEENYLTTLDVSQNTSLNSLFCHKNSLTSLDVSQNSMLTAMWCHENSLSELNVANGNNSNMPTFRAKDNPNLTCIEVDDTTYSNNNWTNIDSSVFFNTDCLTSIFTISRAIPNLNAYPSPTAKNLSIDLGETYNRTAIEVSNIMGEIVFARQYSVVSTRTKLS